MPTDRAAKHCTSADASRESGIDEARPAVARNPPNPSAQPLVTACVLNHNQGRWVVEALESVKNQTYPNLELIVLDDGSSDGSPEAIANWISQHWPSATFLRNAPKCGNIAANMNAMLRAARGEFIAINAADDRMRPDRVSTQVAAVARWPRCVLAFGKAHFIDEESNSMGFDYIGITPPFAGDLVPALLALNCVPTCTVMIRRDVALSINGFDESLFLEDYDMWLRMAAQGDCVAVPDVIADYRRVRGTSISLGRFEQMHRSAEQSLIQFCRRNRLSRTSRCIASRSVLNIVQHRHDQGRGPSFTDICTLLQLRCSAETLAASALALPIPRRLARLPIRLIQRLKRRFGIEQHCGCPDLARRADFWRWPKP